MVFSHLKLTVGGAAYHVLSRIGAAGLDYTQRSNKFAHHVVLDAKERPAAGPAALLGTPGFMDASWSGEPRILPAGRKPLAENLPPAVCRKWQQATGDAGWAGVLAQTATGGNHAAYVIFKTGTETLGLVIEALNLVPATVRWRVSFSTYYTKLPPEIECQWRFVVAGSAEAKAAQRNAHCVTIDLTTKLGRAPDGPLVDSARTGVLMQPRAARTTSEPGRAHAEPIESTSPAGSAPSDKPYEWDFSSAVPDGACPQAASAGAAGKVARGEVASCAFGLCAVMLAIGGAFVARSKLLDSSAEESIAANKESVAAKFDKAGTPPSAAQSPNCRTPQQCQRIFPRQKPLRHLQLGW